MKIKRGIVATIIYLSLLFVIYIIHVKFFRVDVVFYSAIFDAALASLIATIGLFKIFYFRLYNNYEKIQMAVIWLLCGYVLAISVPTVIDRSLSFYILEKIQQRGGGIKLSKFEDVFTKEYVKEYRLVDVRLTEQQDSGTIAIQNGCVKLTKFGNTLANFGAFFRSNLLPKHRLLMGKYTDALIHPFKQSGDDYGYECD